MEVQHHKRTAWLTRKHYNIFNAQNFQKKEFIQNSKKGVVEQCRNDPIAKKQSKQSTARYSH